MQPKFILTPSHIIEQTYGSFESYNNTKENNKALIRMCSVFGYDAHNLPSAEYLEKIANQFKIIISRKLNQEEICKLRVTISFMQTVAKNDTYKTNEVLNKTVNDTADALNEKIRKKFSKIKNPPVNTITIKY